MDLTITETITAVDVVDSKVTVIELAEFDAHYTALGGWLAPPTELTIVSGAITVTQNWHRVDTEGDAATDDLTTVNGMAGGRVVFLRPEDGNRTVVVKHGTGNILCVGNADISLTDAHDFLMLIYDSILGKVLCLRRGGGDFTVHHVVMEIVDKDTLLTTGDGKKAIHIPPEISGMNLVYVHAFNLTPSAVGIPTFQIRNVTDGTDMLSTLLTIDATETGSNTAAVAAVIDTTKDDVVTNDILAVDVDVAGSTTKGVYLTLGFRFP